MLNQFLNLSSFAEQMLIHEHACVAIRKDMPLDRAALIGCGVITGVGAVFHTSNVRPGETVAVIGCGGVGLAAINGAAIAGAGRIIAIDMQPGEGATWPRLRRHRLHQRQGNGDPVKQVQRADQGRRASLLRGDRLSKTPPSRPSTCWRRGGTANIIGMIPVGIKIELHGRGLPGREAHPGLADGLQPLPRRHAAAGRLLHGRQAEARRHDLGAASSLTQVNEAFANMKTGEIAALGDRVR